MRWLARLVDIVAVPRDKGASSDTAQPRPPHAAPFVDFIGTDGAPAMAFTDTMPGYLVAIDRPSAYPSSRAIGVRGHAGPSASASSCNARHEQ